MTRRRHASAPNRRGHVSPGSFTAKVTGAVTADGRTAIPAGSTAVIADVVESDPEALDRRLAGHAATVTRHPLATVEADLGDSPPADAPPTGDR